MKDRLIPGTLVGMWTDRLNRITADLTHTVRGLDHAALNWKLNAEVWSVAQVLEHIIKVNDSYFPILDSVRAGTFRVSWTAKIPYFARLMGKVILNSVKPQNKKKVRTFPIWEPAASSLDIGIVDEFVRHQADLKKLMSSSTDLLGVHTIIHSPANPKIVYSLEDAFHIIVTHEERHLDQVKRILAMQGKS